MDVVDKNIAWWQVFGHLKTSPPCQTATFSKPLTSRTPKHPAGVFGPAPGHSPQRPAPYVAISGRVLGCWGWWGVLFGSAESLQMYWQAFPFEVADTCGWGRTPAVVLSVLLQVLVYRCSFLKHRPVPKLCSWTCWAASESCKCIDSKLKLLIIYEVVQPYRSSTPSHTFECEAQSVFMVNDKEALP